MHFMAPCADIFTRRFRMTQILIYAILLCTFDRTCHSCSAVHQRHASQSVHDGSACPSRSVAPASGIIRWFSHKIQPCLPNIIYLAGFFVSSFVLNLDRLKKKTCNNLATVNRCSISFSSFRYKVCRMPPVEKSSADQGFHYNVFQVTNLGSLQVALTRVVHVAKNLKHSTSHRQSVAWDAQAKTRRINLVNSSFVFPSSHALTNELMRL